MASPEHYELDDSDIEASMPPKDLLQTARDILARPVTQQELARAWDKSSHHPTEDQRVTACLDRLLGGSDLEVNVPQLQPAPPQPPVEAPVVSVANNAGVTAGRLTPKKERRHFVDLSGDSPPAVSFSNSRKRVREEDELRHLVDVGQLPKIRKKTSGTLVKALADNQNNPEALPDWLLQEFANVAARPDQGAANTAEAATVTEPPVQPEDEAIARNSAAIVNGSAAAEAVDDSPLARILAIVPDVDPEHAQKLIEKYSGNSALCVQMAIENLFASNTYPKVQANGSKGKEKELEEDSLLVKLKAFLDRDGRARREGVPNHEYRDEAYVSSPPYRPICN